jgi:hypothetical protein
MLLAWRGHPTRFGQMPNLRLEASNRATLVIFESAVAHLNRTAAAVPEHMHDAAITAGRRRAERRADSSAAVAIPRR